MFLVDSSAWVGDLRRTGSLSHHAVVAAVVDGTAATADPIAIPHDVAVLHRDRDFDMTARHTSLQVSGG
jgi:hypothetical protein